MENPKPEKQDVLKDPKTIAMLSYLTPLGWILALILNNPKTELASFHIRQSLGLILVVLAANSIMIIPFLGWIIAILAMIGAFFLWVIGFMGAVDGKIKLIPYLGEYFQEWFKML